MEKEQRKRERQEGQAIQARQAIQTQQVIQAQQTEQAGSLAQAMETLHRFIRQLSDRAGENEAYADELWERIARSNGILRELAYYHDYGEFLCEYHVAGYTLTDVLVWQVDHFKAYMDRPDEMNRYRRERLLLAAFDILSKMEENPQPYADKMRGETGTDFVDKF